MMLRPPLIALVAVAATLVVLDGGTAAAQACPRDCAAAERDHRGCCPVKPAGATARPAAARTTRGLDPASAGALARLPADVDLIAGLDVATLRRSPLFSPLRRFVEAKVPEVGALKASGLDYERDLLRIVVGLAFEGDGDPIPTVVLQGKLDPAGIQAWFEKTSGKAAVRREEAGLAFVVLDEVAMVPLGGGYLAFTTEANATQLARVKAGEALGADDVPDLVRAVKQARPAGALVWAAANLPTKLRSELERNADASFSTLSTVAARATLGAALQAEATLAFGDADSARRASEIVRLGLAEVKASSDATNLGVADAIAAIAVRSRNAAAQLTVKLGKKAAVATLERLITALD